MKKLIAVLIGLSFACNKSPEIVQAPRVASFDFAHPVIQKTDVGTVTVIKSAPKNGTQWGRALFTRASDGRVALMYIRMVKRGDIGLITYFDAKLKNHVTVKLNFKLKTVTTDRPATPATAQHKGQDVMNCINDIYSNHGWVSVAMWGISLFVPETGVMVIVRCVTYDGFKNVRGDYITIQDLTTGQWDTVYQLTDSTIYIDTSIINTDSL